MVPSSMFVAQQQLLLKQAREAERQRQVLLKQAQEQKRKEQQKKNQPTTTQAGNNLTR